jgi:N-ethylmaleimide reductase
MPDLFAPVEVGSLKLSNGIVMAPMSRNRADAAEAAHALTATYYAQRATAGLIVHQDRAPSRAPKQANRVRTA